MFGSVGQWCIICFCGALKLFIFIARVFSEFFFKNLVMSTVSGCGVSITFATFPLIHSSPEGNNDSNLKYTLLKSFRATFFLRYRASPSCLSLPYAFGKPQPCHLPSL